MKKQHIALFLCGISASTSVLGNNPTTTKVDSVRSGYEINSPNIDVAKSLYGKIPGLNVYQGTGASWDNLAQLSIHGNSPLVLVDGFPRDLKDLTINEVESISILTDAAATALYGVRGANGVVLVKTKRGHDGRLNVSANYQFGLHTQFRAPEFSNAFTYANALNTALSGDGLSPKYNENELNAFRNNTFPDAYPNVDWWNEVYRKTAENHRMNLTFDGGNDKFRYYSVIDYMFDKGFFRHEGADDRYSTKPSDTRLNVRTNIDVNITESTELKLGIAGKLMETNQANFGNIYRILYNTPSAAFPVKNGYGIYGGSAVYGANNPVALLMDSGNKRTTAGTLLADLSLKQDFSALLSGLSGEIAASFDNVGVMSDGTSKEYRYQDLQPTILEDGTLVTKPVIFGRDSEVLSHSQDFTSLYMRSDLQVRLNYATQIQKHGIGASILYEQQSYTANGRNRSIRRQSITGCFSYNYSNLYEVNGVLSYGGSGYLAEGNRFNLYPAINAAWNISNEEFLQATSGLDLWKIYASFGYSGWDGNLTHELFRQSYGGTNAGEYYFTNNISQYWGQAEGNLPVENLVPEKSRKITLGTDVAILNNRLSINVQGFMERRSDILVSSGSSVSGIIGIGVGMLNAGISEYRGFDAGIRWNDAVGNWNYGMYANGSYLDSEVINENQEYQQYDYLYHKGNRVGQRYGLEVTGIFQNQMEINNSPVQTFSTVRPGDLKYKDQNGDNRIDDQDMVRMFGSSVPRFYFGFGFNVGYKGVEVAAEFQGMTGVTVNLLNSPLYQPLMNNGNISDTFLDNETPWTPVNAESATMPRLTTLSNANNYRNNSLWYRDGSFLKLRNLQVSYTLPEKLIPFANAQVYLQGTNLFSLDNLGSIDPEQLGANYPSLRSYWVGAKFFF